jgi:hypothetical protein
LTSREAGVAIFKADAGVIVTAALKAAMRKILPMADE